MLASVAKHYEELGCNGSCGSLNGITNKLSVGYMEHTEVHSD